MRIRFLWPFFVLVMTVLSGPSCEDDPNDLDYLKDASADAAKPTGDATTPMPMSDAAASMTDAAASTQTDAAK
jgi:hypothetical protein